MDQPRLFTPKHELLKISVHLQTAFATEIHLAEEQWLKGATKCGKVTYVLSRNMNSTVLRTGAILSACEDIY
jgi:hypothetical protein